MTKSKMYHKGNFHFRLNETPGITLTYYNTKQKVAMERASRAAPGCTFTIKEF